MSTAATYLALVFVVAVAISMLMVGVHIKAGRFGPRLPQMHTHMTRKMTKKVDDVEIPKRRRKRRAERRSKFQKLVKYFIADGEESAESDNEKNAYELDDVAWLEPEQAAALRAMDFFIGEDITADPSPSSNSVVDEFCMEDDIWRAPPVAAA